MHRERFMKANLLTVYCRAMDTMSGLMERSIRAFGAGIR